MRYTRTYIRDMLLTDDRWLVRGLIAIYRRQTRDEQLVQQTHEHNGRGFNSSDAYILSSFAKQAIAGRPLSYRQLEITRKKLPKYARQLEQVANARTETPALVGAGR
jgi:hypothetical protein